MVKKSTKCWLPEEAERKIHGYAKDDGNLDLAYTKHAKTRMSERDIFISDVKYILAHGHIDEQPEHSTRSQDGYFKYKICGKSPNSGNREICLVVIPDIHKPAVKIITAMWRDEK